MEGKIKTYNQNPFLNEHKASQIKKQSQSQKEEFEKVNIDLEKAILSKNELSITNIKLKDRLEYLNKENSRLSYELSTAKEEKTSYSQLIISLNEALNAAKKEIIRLKEMIDTIESENIKKNDEYFNEKKEFLQKKDLFLNEKSKMSVQIKELNKKLNEFEEINKENKEKLKESQITKRKYEELEIKYSQLEVKYNKNISELLELRLKYNEEENLKQKLNSVIKSKNDKVELMKEENKNLKESIKNLLSEVKWGKELSLQKENLCLSLKEKIKKCEADLINAEIAYNNIRQKKGIGVCSKCNSEKKEESSGKLVLFGPEN